MTMVVVLNRSWTVLKDSSTLKRPQKQFLKRSMGTILHHTVQQLKFELPSLMSLRALELEVFDGHFIFILLLIVYI